MQLKLGEDPQQMRKEIELKRLQEEKERRRREERIRYFRENFRYGSTIVLKHEGEFYFWGDIAHCGSENIFHNARKIKSMMENNGHTRLIRLQTYAFFQIIFLIFVRKSNAFNTTRTSSPTQYNQAKLKVKSNTR